MPKATVIGKVAVKVIPDTSTFKKDTQAALDRLEREVGFEVKLLPSDTEEFSEKVKETIKKVQAEAGSINISLDLENAESVHAAIDRIKAELASMHEETINLDLDEGTLQAKLAELKNGLNETAKLKFKVDPNSEASMKAALAKIEKELAGRTELEVSVGADRVSLERAAEEIRNRLADAANVAAKIKLDVANAQYAQEKAEVQKRLDAMNLQALVGIGVSRAEVDEAQEKIKRLLADSVAIEATVTPDMDDRARDQVLRQVDDLKHKVNNIAAEVKPNYGSTDGDKVKFELAKLAKDRIVDFIPKVSKVAAAKVATQLSALSGARSLQEMSEEIKDFLSNLDKSAPKIAAISLALINLTGYLLTAVGNLFAFGASLAHIAPLALALPGTFGGIAVAVTVLVVAFKNINKIVPQVKKAWGQIKTTISDNFWAKAAKPLNQFVNSLLPTFKKGFASVSKQLGSLFGNLFSEMSKDGFAKAVSSMFDQLSKSIGIIARHAPQITNIIKILGTAGTSILPRLATAVGDLATKFSNWLNKVSKSGQLKQWINGALTLFDQLGHIIGNVGKIFSGIGGAALKGGGSALKGVAETLNQVAKAVNSPGFQKALVALFQAAYKGMHELSTIAGGPFKTFMTALAKLLSHILPTAGKTLGTALGAIFKTLGNPAITKGVIALFNGIAKGVQALAPALPKLAKPLGALGQFLGTFVGDLGGTLSVAIRAIAPALTILFHALQPVANVLAHTLQGALKALAPILPPLARDLAKIATALLPVLGNAILSMLKAMMPMIPQLATGFTQVVIALMPLIPPLAKLAVALLPLLFQVIKPLLPLIVDLVKVLVPIIKVVLDVLTAFVRFGNYISGKIFSGLVALIKAPFAALQWAYDNIVKPTVGWILKELDKLVDWFKSTTLGKLLMGMFDGLKWVYEHVVKKFVGLIKSVLGSIKTVAGWLKTGLSDVYDEAKDLVGDGGHLVGSSNKLSEWLDEARKAAQKLWEQLGSVIDRVVRLIRQQGKVKQLGKNGGDPHGTNAAGTNAWTGGTTWVGEQGPELLRLPAGSQIASNFNSINGVMSALAGAVGTSSSGTTDQSRTFNYHAAPNSSLSSEEELFQAVARSRFAW